MEVGTPRHADARRAGAGPIGDSPAHLLPVSVIRVPSRRPAPMPWEAPAMTAAFFEGVLAMILQTVSVTRVSCAGNR